MACSASPVSAPAISAIFIRFIASYSVFRPTAVSICVPLLSASPSLDASTTGVKSACANASFASITSPLYSTLPKPIKPSAMHESGAKSPEAPTEPFSGTIGWIPAFSISSKVCRVSSRMPEFPLAREFALKSIAALTYFCSYGLPIEQVWLIIKFRCSTAVCSVSIATFANLPKPVVSP